MAKNHLEKSKNPAKEIFQKKIVKTKITDSWTKAKKQTTIKKNTPETYLWNNLPLAVV